MKTFLLAVLTLMMLTQAQAQKDKRWQHKQQGLGGDNTVYFVTYFSNANSESLSDSTVRVINDGDTNANLWAAYYVFDDRQELSECCACVTTPDGIDSESVNLELTSNPLTGRVLTRGAIKVIASSTGDPTALKPTAGLRGWATHVQSSGDVTETLLAPSNLSSGEQSLLQNLCYYLGILGSGQGICSCTPEGSDF